MGSRMGNRLSALPQPTLIATVTNAPAARLMAARECNQDFFDGRRSKAIRTSDGQTKGRHVGALLECLRSEAYFEPDLVIRASCRADADPGRDAQELGVEAVEPGVEDVAGRDM